MDERKRVCEDRRHKRDRVKRERRKGRSVISGVQTTVGVYILWLVSFVRLARHLDQDKNVLCSSTYTFVLYPSAPSMG